MNAKTQKILIIIGLCGSFFVFGFLDNLKGPTIPFIIRDLNINYSLMANILSVEYVGFFTATLLSGALIFRFGLKNIFLVALICLLLAVALAAGIPVYLILFSAFILLGLGLGGLELIVSSTAVIISKDNKGGFLNLVNAFHGIGSTLVPFYAGSLLAAEISWRVVFAICLIPIALVIAFNVFVKFPDYQSNKPESVFSLAKSAFSGDMVLHYLALSSYVAAEIGLAAWIVEYMLKFKGQTIFFSSISLSVFFGLFTLGRLIGIFLVDKVGHLRVLYFTSLGALFCLLLGISGPDYLVFFLPLTGFFFSIIYPTLVASFTDISRSGSEKYLGILFTCAGIGGILGPWLIGVCGQIFGLANSIGLLIIYTLIMLAALTVLWFNKSHPNSEV